LTGLCGKTPRVLAMIDLPDLRWQLKRIGVAPRREVAAVVRRLEAGLAKLDPGSSAALLPLDDVYLYSATEMDRSGGVESAILRERGIGVRRECQGCGKECTHCRGGGVKDAVGQGRDSLIANDLIELARQDAYDWAVIVSTDVWLIPVVRFVQSHGRKIVHGCFPPVAADLTKECWASIDPRRTAAWPDGASAG
jgi:hypothetical protein